MAEAFPECNREIFRARKTAIGALRRGAGPFRPGLAGSKPAGTGVRRARREKGRIVGQGNSEAQSDESSLDRARAEPLFAYLAERGIAATTTWHAPVFTVDASADLISRLAGGHTKNLFLKDKKGRIFLVVAEQDTDVDLKGLHRKIGAQGRLSFGDAARMQALLGVFPGAVTAFGLMNDHEGAVTLILDERLLRHDIINAHPLTNAATTSISRVDLMRFFEATGHAVTVVDLTATGDEQTEEEAVR